MLALALTLIFLFFSRAGALSVSLPDTVGVGQSAQATWQRNPVDPQIFALRLRTDAGNNDVEIRDVDSNLESTGQVAFQFPEAGTFLIEILADPTTPGGQSRNLGGSNKITVGSGTGTITPPASITTSTSVNDNEPASVTTITVVRSTTNTASPPQITALDDDSRSDEVFRVDASPTSGMLGADSNTPTQSGAPSTQTVIIIAAVLGGLFVLTLLVLLALWCRCYARRRRTTRFESDMMVRHNGAPLLFSRVIPKTESAKNADASPYPFSRSISSVEKGIISSPMSIAAAPTSTPASFRIPRKPAPALSRPISARPPET